MRQAGVLAAAASYALEHHRVRLAEDHDNAKRLAAGVAELPGVRCEVAETETNIVNFDLDDAGAFVKRAAARGVLVNATGPTRVRAVTHLDVSASDIDRALAVLAELLP